MKKVKIPSITYKKLPKRINGYWYPPKKQSVHHPGRIEIQRNLDSQTLLETLIHELLHEYFPDITEEKVTSSAVCIAYALWDHNFREVKQP